ncbi:sensor histidine kinase, partial [Streptomyces alkaliterrae]
MPFRGRTIRRKIVALLLIPLTALTVIWVFATHHTAVEAMRMLDAKSARDTLGEPIERTVRAVQRERRHALVYLADPRRSEALPQLHRHQRHTDRAVSDVTERAPAVRGRLGEDTRARLDAFVTGLDVLRSLRGRVERNTISRDHTLVAYNDLVDPSYELLNGLQAIDHADLDREARALVGAARARELLSRQDALMAAALAAGRMTDHEHREFSDRVAERRVLYQTSLDALPETDARAYEEYWRGSDGRALTAFENDVFNAGPDRAVRVLNAERWQSATGTALTGLETLDRSGRERHEERIAPVRLSVLLQAGTAALLGLVAGALSVFVSLRVGRGLVRDLRALRKEANEAAGVRLPGVQRRLAAGEQVDVETEAPRLEYGRDEVGQVGQALNTLQRAAVEGAVRQADMRRGVSEVFVNLARRSQVLLHRQLNVLEGIRRRTEDPVETADLDRLDHLTARMRRHAEGLVILSGAAPSRQWRKPVALIDVVRAATAEVEDHERVEVRRLADLAVDGAAVADLTHLVAELLENATAFSPPHTAVQVMGERVANGFTLEIHDRGLGMTADALLEANLRLAETPEFELSDTDRLGLLVVARLAQRQGARVSLQPSPYGGTTAVVLIPGAVLNEITDDLDLDTGLPERPGSTPPLAFAQRLS